MRIPRYHRPTLQRIARELPWLAAVYLSTTLLLDAAPNINHPWGSNWPMYFEAARYFWDPTAAYFGWRPPLYPLALATIGEAIGYVPGAHLIARASMVVVVFSTGTIARMTVGVGAAILASLSIPLLQCAVEGAMWTNMYPPAAAALSLAIALSVALKRWPSVGLALVAGVGAGVAWRINHLGLVAVPLSLGMAALGARNKRQLLLMPLALSLGIGSMVAIDQWVVERWNVPQESLSDQVIQRRHEELSRIKAGSSGPASFEACTDFEAKALNISDLTNTCGQQFVAANYGTLQAEDCVPSLPTLMWLLPLALLPCPRRRSWREVAESVLIYGGPIGAFLVAAAWTSYAEKYIISYLAPMVLIAPMAFDRLGGWLGRLVGHVKLGRSLGWVVAAVWIIGVWPGANKLAADRPNIQQDWESHAGTVADWATATLQPKDLLIDCVPLNVRLVILPAKANILEGVSTEYDCMRWAKTPPKRGGAVYMVQQSFDRVAHTSPEHLRAQGWVLLKTLDDRHRLWTAQAPATTAPSK